MWRLTKFLFLAALLWSLWWWIGKEGLEDGLAAWLDARRAEGWVAEAGAFAVTGYPGRFEARIAGLELADPETGLAWTAPGFRFRSPAWDPTDFTAFWPPEQVVATPGERIRVTARGLSARLALMPGPALTLRAAEAEAEMLALDSSLGWEARLDSARLTAARSPDGENALDLRFDAAALEPSAPMLARIDPAGRLPRRIDLLSLDATFGFDAPWDRYAVERRRPQPRSLDLRRLKASWGALDLEAAGTLTIDAEGIPSGEIQLRAVNWRDLLELGRDHGLIPPEIDGTIAAGLELLAAATGNPNTLDVPLSFAGGRVLLGPIPLGPAPRLALR